jgi:ribonuclease P protein component
VENKSRFRSLSRRADFLNLKARGLSVHINGWLLVNLQKTELKQFRCGFTLPRQTGTAVVRNRLRRWGKEYFRKWCVKNRTSLDLNLIFKRRGKGFYASLTHKEFDEALEKLALKLARYVE